MDSFQCNPSAASVSDDLVGAAGYLARRIEVFDSQQPFAAGATRIEIAGGRCDERPEVQRAGGRRCETPAIFGNDVSRLIYTDRTYLYRSSRSPYCFSDVRGAPALDAQGRNRAGFEPLDADLLAGLDAVTVRDPSSMRLIASSILRISLRSRSRVRSSRLNSDSCVARSFGSGKVRRLVLHVKHSAVHLVHEVTLPGVEDQPEVLRLLLVHVLLAAARDVRFDVARAGQQVGAGDVRAVALVGIAAGRSLEVVDVQWCHRSRWNRGLGWNRRGRSDRPSLGP